MMQLLFGLLYVLSLVWATPIDLPSSTIDLSAAAAQGTGMPVVPTDLGEPVDGSSFFSILPSCFKQTKVHSGYTDRGAFYKQAIKDATQIADAATKWPQLGSDVSDLYFSQGTDTSIYAKNISENLKAAADWDHPRWGFDPYIILSCDDNQNLCGNKIGSDPRSIGCYVNNTANLWWTESRVTCCDPFFTLDNIDQIFQQEKNNDPKNMALQYMRVGGSYLLHEMMHANKISQTRPHIIDQVFTGSTGKRIYGPADVAKAARIEDKGITCTNADSYATFALAMYWKDLFNAVIQPTVANTPAPANYLDLITDNDVDFISLVLPPPMPSCAGNPSFKPSADQSYVQSKITDYCDYITSAGWVVNATTGVYGPVGYAAGTAAPASDNDLWISVAFDPKCNANVAYTVAPTDCQAYLGAALNGCNTDSSTAKWGGQVEAECTLWNITTRFGSDSTPPNGFPQLSPVH